MATVPVSPEAVEQWLSGAIMQTTARRGRVRFRKRIGAVNAQGRQSGHYACIRVPRIVSSRHAKKGCKACGERAMLLQGGP